MKKSLMLIPGIINGTMVGSLLRVANIGFDNPVFWLCIALVGFSSWLYVYIAKNYHIGNQ